MRYIYSLLILLLAFASANADKFIVEFDATWCGPCKILAEKLDKDTEGKDLLLKYRGLLKYDIDRYPQTAKNFKISSVPAYLILDITEKDGKLTTSLIDTWAPPRTDTLESLKNFLRKNLK